ncbi:MAG: type II toxin-antitoxin system RelE/ParE family toxin [Spirochaetes bacterium]|nr:MAG: type II toxin-antitoxin system RelE/ParE family toxin [Spirochaetota bacterium]
MVKWTASSRKDLRHIHDHIAEESGYYAKKVLVSVVTRADVLKDFPQMGRMVPEFQNPSIREIIVYSYRIIYEIHGDAVEILAVIHGKRNLEDVLSPP